MAILPPAAGDNEGMAELFAGRYAFVDPLAEGGMGTIWRVWDHREQDYRAAKLLKQSDSASLLRFVRETSWRIDHDHVVTPIGWSAEDDRVLFTMPLVGGGTVADLVADFGALPPPWVVELIGQLLAGLAAVHAVGLVHRDVKPSNLLLDATGTGRPRLRLADFGIAAAVSDPRLTRVGDLLGTPGYQAPEARSGLDPDPRQDLYAVGVVALELLTGRRPNAVGERVPVEIGGDPLGEVLGRLLNAVPEARYESATAAREALQAVRIPFADAGHEVEVFDQLPPLPRGWSEHGPESEAGHFSARHKRPARQARRAGPALRTPVQRTWLPLVALAVTVLGVVCLVLGLVLLR